MSSKTTDHNHPFTLLDGGFGTELRARGVKVADYKSSIWSAFAILEAPDAIIDLHVDYINAGADIIAANTYSVTRIQLAREGMEDQLADMLEEALYLAQEAVQQSTNPLAKIGTSLGPLNTTYRADLVGSYEDNLAAYREMVDITAELTDVFMVETMSTADEALAAATAAVASGKPTYLSFTITPQTGTLRSGEDIATAVKAIGHLPLAGILFNCADCETITKVLPILRALTDLPIGAYANPVMHEPPANGEPEWSLANPLSAEEYTAVAKQWMAAGASIIGGCCDTNPDFIKELNKLR
jgi:S-methylmethionine-dependent homocysteine/selenocysteine methylase